MATAWPAIGTVIAVDETGGGTYTAVGQVTSIKGVGGGEVGERDVTNLSSTVKATMPTIPDNGEVSFETNADPTDAVHKFLQAEKESPPSGGSRSWKVTFAATGPPTKIFNGFVKSLDGIDADGPDDNLKRSVTVRVNSSITSSP